MKLGFEVGDRVRLVNLDEWSDLEQEMLNGKTGVVIEDKWPNLTSDKFVDVMLDDKGDYKHSELPMLPEELEKL